ncbi:preprotein translocase subunit SecG [Laribacter hongkongensis]|uniref:preprotein translocase subunit SecG n=1 Tax=Laribacter hongkongensis TaxID=168471 RepID=UPI001EFD99FA|nr:preprotein translocase subunit SecG [Laribacter hongkongensis]MCG9082211.1 preprotein translocase subunit SecG [Laribacter hongkongensis]
MEILKTLVWIVNIVSAIAVIVLVLMQHGKGADMGAAFGSGSSGSLFGASGSANFLSRTTAVCSTVFFATCLAMALMFGVPKKESALGVMSGQAVPQKVQQNAGDNLANQNSNPSGNKIPD